jgi:hypothetical protein
MVAISPLRYDSEPPIPQPFASKVVYDAITLLTKELMETPFNLEKARYLISQGSDPNILLPNGDRPILFCASIESMRFMIEETSFDPSLPLVDGCSITSGACMYLHSKVLRYFLLGDHVEKYESDRKMPFADLRTLVRDYYRCLELRCHPLSTEYMLREGNLDLLMHQDIVKKYGSVVNIPCFESGDTLLHLAAAVGAVGDMTKLLKAGANANALNHDGMLPIHHLQYIALESTANALLDATQDPIDFFTTVKYNPQGRSGWNLSLFQTSIRAKRWKIVRRAMDSGNPSSETMTSQLFHQLGVPATPLIRHFNNDYVKGIPLLLDIMERWKLPASEFRAAPSSIFSLFWTLHLSESTLFKEFVELGVPIDLYFIATVLPRIGKTLLRFLVSKCDDIPRNRNHLTYIFNILKSVLGDGKAQLAAPVLQFISTSSAADASQITVMIGSNDAKACLLAAMITASPATAWSRSRFFRCANFIVDLLQRVAPSDFDWKHLEALLSDELKNNLTKRSSKCQPLLQRLKDLSSAQPKPSKASETPQLS